MNAITELIDSLEYLLSEVEVGTPVSASVHRLIADAIDGNVHADNVLDSYKTIILENENTIDSLKNEADSSDKRADELIDNLAKMVNYAARLEQEFREFGKTLEMPIVELVVELRIQNLREKILG